MKKQEKENLKKLLNNLYAESDKRQKYDIESLRKPYYFKGRFNSLNDKLKKQKIKEYYKQEKKQTKNEILELISYEDFKSFTACLDWVRSSVWGMNPHAKIIVNNKYVGFGSASGCGYDKRSAAICYATNNNDNAKKIILGAVIRKYIQTGEALPYGIYSSSKIYLHFDGCGVETLRDILKYCGLNTNYGEGWQWHETKTSDFITCTK